MQKHSMRKNKLSAMKSKPALKQTDDQIFMDWTPRLILNFGCLGHRLPNYIAGVARAKRLTVDAGFVDVVALVDVVTLVVEVGLVEVEAGRVVVEVTALVVVVVAREVVVLCAVAMVVTRVVLLTTVKT